MKRDKIEIIAKEVIDASIRVHRELGPGLLESVYQFCLAEELKLRGLMVRSEVFLPLTYRGRLLNKDFRIDLLIEEEIIIEVKSVDGIAPIHEAQLLSYLRLSGKWLGFLLNFNVPVMREGIRRRVNGFR
ncbi:MAG: GxxExxY protein [Bacteroidetes bacterium]|nr:MAG: GxxExxY protein [Bacteroidota bacterium]